MHGLPSRTAFSAAYGSLRIQGEQTTEEIAFFEDELQALWHTGAFPDRLSTREGHRVRILSPGWWNKLPGPDFTNAQVEFNGNLCTGDIEIHSDAADWYAHGHHNDPAYTNVILHVVLALPPKKAKPAVTAAGRKIATLVIPGELLSKAPGHRAEIPERCGQCATALSRQGTRTLEYFLDLAGEWRILDKSRRIRERMARVGTEQAIYEVFMTACGYSQYKKSFQLMAESLPYERARQLAQQEPMALEAAFFRIAGLWPEEWPADNDPPEHYQRITALLRNELPGLKSLGLIWPRSVSRPANSPERRLAGAARFLSRTADRGLEKRLDLVWRQPVPPIERRRALERLFGGATGFWASHFSWQGNRARNAAAPLGEGRIRTIIGNVLIPAALALTRSDRPDPVLEKNVFELFVKLPREPENRIHRRMMHWLALGDNTVKMNFRRQQGLMQIHEDWCAHNPSCRNCSVLAYLRSLDGIENRREEVEGKGLKGQNGPKGPEGQQ
ncbi:MAG: hypothetical protein BWX80_01098 [Candidatus Hydrogenedentes bacterium ADurb.Bin101]|jgi:hypothetical protein|nr:MAG: hypothetical protein BWX80_01098 [Candidatus Hydrogenedentes bacterium ADurb.Bin101]HOC68718.1 DUF2851 family protein [Candidatus Hydrogenedentota bacterium]